MDPSPKSERQPPRATIRQEDLEQERSVSYVPCPVESGGAFSLQVLEFKTCLLEAIEELQIRRDAEIRFGQQISKLALEKQELEWQKEALQHQLDTMTQQHSDALASVKKQLQRKMKVIEEEKGIHQLNAQSKDNAINGLKEELKVLQLSTYSLEKKSSELEWEAEGDSQEEQKLALQSRSKDSHLTQLREVERRFGLLSRLCATVKQAHGKLEQDVDEAMRINRKLTSINEKQESTVASLSQELDEMHRKLIQVKVSSAVHSEGGDASAREQRAEQLQQRLLMETEMNRKLMGENAAERAEKQELTRSLQAAHQLLLSQTPALLRMELELHQHTEEYQALKRDHQATLVESAAAERRAARLTEEQDIVRTVWETEKARLVESVEEEQRSHGSTRDAYDWLYQKHSELSSQTLQRAQHTPGLQIRDDGQAHNTSTTATPLFCRAEEHAGDGSLHESSLDPETPHPGSVRGLVPPQTGDPDSAVVMNELAAARATRGQEGSSNTPSLQRVESSIPPCLVAIPVATGSLVGQHTHHGPTYSLSTEAPYPGTRKCDPVPLADTIDNTVCLSSNVGLPKDHKSSISGPENRYVYEDNADLVTDAPTAAGRDGANIESSEQESSTLTAEGTREYQEGLRGDKEDECIRQLSVYSSGREDSGERLTKDAAETRQADMVPEDREETDNKTKSGQEGERTHLVGKGLGSLARSPDTEIGRMTSANNAARDGMRRHALQGIDPPESTEPPLSASQPATSPLLLEVAGIHADASSSSSVTTDSGAVAHVNPAAAQHHSSGCLRTAPGSETSVSSREGPLNIPLECAHPSPCCFPLSPTLPDSPLSNCTAGPGQSDTQDAVFRCNASHVVDGSGTSHEDGGKCDKPGKEEGVVVSRVVETQQLLNRENSHMESTSKDLSSSESRRGQIPVLLPVIEADVQDESICDASPDDPSRAVIVQQLQSLPGSLRSALPDEDANNTDVNVNTAAGDTERRQLPVGQAEAAQMKEVDDPSATEQKPPDRPCHESPPKAHPSGYCPGDEDIIDHSALCSAKKYRSSFEWARFQRQKAAARPPQGLSSTSINVNQNRASSLPNASGAPKRNQQGEWKAITLAFRDTAAEDAENRGSPSLTFRPFSTSAGMGSGYGRPSPTPGPCPGSSSGSECFPLSSQENQQSSLRDQISRIEQFLSAERLLLPKRRRTEN